MKTKFLLIALLIVAFTEKNNAQSGLVACYPLDNNANDYSGNNYNGAAYNVTPTTGHTGIANTAYHFSGSGSYINLPYSGFLLNQFTYSAWCRPTSLPSSGSYYSVLSIGGTTADQYMFIGNTSGQTGFGGSTWSVSQQVQHCGSGTLPAINQWYHLVMTVDNNTMNIYVNNALVCFQSIGNLNPGYLNNPLAATIGSRLSANYQNFIGDIDNVKIFNRVLSLSEIQNISDSCSAASASCLVACYPLANNANDYSGNNYNGTAYNVTPTTSHLGVTNGAYHFSGAGSYINLPYSNFLLNQFTYSAWCRPTSLPNSGNIYSILAIGGTTADQYFFIDNTILFGFGGSTWNVNAQVQHCGTGSLPTVNQWYHLVITVDNNTMNVYLNNALACSKSIGNLSPGYLGSPLAATIGSRLSANYQNFIGDIDNVRIYNCVLSLTEIINMPASCLASLPTVNFSSSDTTFCNEGGKCIDFSDLSTNSPTSWQWLFPGANPDTSTQQNPVNICYSSAGTYSVTLIAANSAGADTLTVSPMISFANPPAVPVLTIKGSDTIICSHACSYQWYFNGAIITGATDSFYVATQNGTYSTQISDCIGCSVLSNGIIFPLGIDELNNEQQIKIYPNPVTSSFFIQLTSQLKNAEVVIYDVLGTEMMRKKLIGGRIEIEKGDIERGFYFVSVRSEDRQWVEKLVVE